MRIPLLPLLILALIALGLYSCEKEPGEGGRAVITGKVMVREFSEAGNLVAEYYVAEKQTYIIYGSGSIHDDNMRTSYDGSYRFEFLRKGEYTLFVMSECPSCPSGEEPVFAEVEISDNKEVVTVPDIVIEEHD